MPTPLWWDNIRVNRKFFDMDDPRRTIASLPGRRTGEYDKAVVIAAGPSLEKNSRKLLGVERVLLIAVEAAAPYLFDAGIIPHIVVTAEEQANSAIIFKRFKGWFPGVCLACSTTASPLGLYICRSLGASLYFYNNAHASLNYRYTMKILPVNYPHLVPLCGSITFHAVALAGYMGIESVALVGADFHVASGKKTHAGDYKVDGIPADAMNEAFAWHQRELEMAKAQLTNVVNCTEGGVLDVFQRQPLETFLEANYRRQEAKPAALPDYNTR